MERKYIKTFEQFVIEDAIPGGKGDNTDISKLDQKELKVGIEVEFEHTNDKEKATEIATDHLTEEPKYYSKLIKDGLADEPKALKLAKEFWGIEVKESVESLNESDYEKIAIENFKTWNDLLKTKDPKKIADLYLDDATFLPTMSGKFEKGKDGAKEYFEHFMKKDPDGKIINHIVQVIDEQHYLESGMYDFEVGPEDKRIIVHARFTFLWQKNDNDWKISHHHSSLEPK